MKKSLECGITNSVQLIAEILELHKSRERLAFKLGAIVIECIVVFGCRVVVLTRSDLGLLHCSVVTIEPTEGMLV